VEKYGRAGQATDGNTIRRMGVACWITKATYKHPEYVIPIFDGNNGFLNAAHCYVVPILFISCSNKWKPLNSMMRLATGDWSVCLQQQVRRPLWNRNCILKCLWQSYLLVRLG